MKIPLHRKPDDYSPEACEERLSLQMTAQNINPSGFRQMRKINPKPTRNEALAKKAGFGIAA